MQGHTTMLVESLEFQSDDTMILTVRMYPNGIHMTQKLPHLWRRLKHLFPSMVNHACDNGFIGKPFDVECEDTEIPHLLEHLIIELHTRVYTGHKFSGKTTWGRGLPKHTYMLELTYVDMLVAVAVIRLALKLLMAVDTCDVTTTLSTLVDAEMTRLKRIATLSQVLGETLPIGAALSWEGSVEE